MNTRPRRRITALPSALQQYTGRMDVPGHVKLRQLAIDGRLGSSVSQASNGHWEWEDGTEAQIAAALGLTPRAPGAPAAALASAA